MSQILVNAYLNEIDRLRKFSGSFTEGVISEAFKDLLKAWSRQHALGEAGLRPECPSGSGSADQVGR